MSLRKWGNIPDSTWKRAKLLRREQTAMEQLLWQRLRDEQLGVRFRRQHPFGPYILDFICVERELVIEVDGAVHDADDQKERDQRRSELLTEFGLRVLRVSNEAVAEDMEGVIALIQEFLSAE